MSHTPSNDDLLANIYDCLNAVVSDMAELDKNLSGQAEKDQLAEETIRDVLLKNVLLKSINGELQEELTDIGHEYKNLQQRNEMLYDELEQAQQDLRSQHVDYDTLKDDLKEAEAKLKRYQLHDPERLIKNNKDLKSKNADLTKRLSSSEKARNEALKQHKMMLAKLQNSGILDAWADPKTGEALRLISNIAVSKKNEYDGVARTPIIEYYQRDSGVSRQGVLNNDGGISWGTVDISMPPTRISDKAREVITEYCDIQNIKIPKEARR